MAASAVGRLLFALLLVGCSSSSDSRGGTPQPRVDVTAEFCGKAHDVDAVELECRGHLESPLHLDLSTLRPFTKLRRLKLGFVDVAQPEALRELSQLRLLSISPGSLRDLHFVAGHPSLSSLDVGGNKITSVAPLANVPKLRTLNIESNPIADYAPLERLRRLTTLRLGWSEFRDLTLLAGLESLEVLSINRSRVSDLRPLSSLGKLRVLDIGWNPQIKNLTGLSSLHRLEKLHAYDTGVVDLGPAASLPNLTFLSLVRTSVRDVRPLARAHALRVLELPVGVSGKQVRALRRARPKLHIEIGVHEDRPSTSTQ